MGADVGRGVGAAVGRGDAVAVGALVGAGVGFAVGAGVAGGAVGAVEEVRAGDGDAAGGAEVAADAVGAGGSIDGLPPGVPATAEGPDVEAPGAQPARAHATAIAARRVTRWRRIGRGGIFMRRSTHHAADRISGPRLRGHERSAATGRGRPWHGQTVSLLPDPGVLPGRCSFVRMPDPDLGPQQSHHRWAVADGDPRLMARQEARTPGRGLRARSN